MIRLFLVSFMTVLASFHGFSQEQSALITWGQEYKFEKRMKISGMLSDSSFFYVVKKSSGRKSDQPDLYIERYRETTMSLDRKMAVSIPKPEGQSASFFDLLIVGDQMWLFMESWLKMGKNGKLWASRIDVENDSVYTPILVDQFELLNQRNEFELVEAYDGKSLLVLHNHPFEKYNNEKFSYKVYNGEMKLQWEKQIELPYKDRMFRVSHHLLDKHGNVHMISAVQPEWTKGDTRENSVSNNQYNLLSYYPEQNLLKEFEIGLGEKWISALTFDMAPDGSLVIAGFYSNSAAYSIAGTFYLRMDPISRKVKDSNLKPFDKDFLLEFLPEKKVKKGVELSDFYFDHLVVREDGSAILVAEQYYMQVVYTYNDPYMNGMYGYGFGSWNYSPYYRSNYNYQYYYNDIIVVSISSSGEIEWTKKIPKRQMSSNDGGYYSSYSLASNERYVYLLFNDNPRNTPEYRAKYSDPYAMTKPSKSTAMLVTIDREGKFAYMGLFSQKDMNLILRPKLYYQSTADQMILFSQRGTRYKFGAVKLP